MMESFMKIAVYCGASVGNEPSFATAAQELGQWIASRKNTLVYGGGKAGLMGVLADAVLENGGQVIGVIPTFLSGTSTSWIDRTPCRRDDVRKKTKNVRIVAGVCRTARWSRDAGRNHGDDLVVKNRSKPESLCFL